VALQRQTSASVSKRSALFSVSTRLRGLPRVASAYGVDSTPTFIVNGKYLNNPSMVAQANPGIPD
jgi:thiol:disulfide interchange protein DsbA